MWTMLRQSSLRPDLPELLDGLKPVIPQARRLMFTTDGATPSFYAQQGMIAGCLRIATEHGIDDMRALQMATIDPATFLGLDEELGGIAPGRRATLNILGEGWTPETVYVNGEVVAEHGRLTARAARDPLARRPTGDRAEGLHAAHGRPARRPLRVRGDQPPPRPRGHAH